MYTPAMASAGHRYQDSRFLVFNGAASVLVLGFLTWLLLGRSMNGGSQLDFMPAVNACFNGGAALLLCLGYVAIRRGRRDIHRYLMVAALALSLLFLAGYVAYHFVHGDTHYEGPARALYLAILASHVLLSMALVPLVIAVIYFIARGRTRSHRRVARITLPIWLYVSVTGVVVYLMLHG